MPGTTVLLITTINPLGNSLRIDSTILVSQPPSSFGGVGTATYAIFTLSVTSDREVPLSGS